MREIRTYGSEGGEAPQGAFPTLIQQKTLRLSVSAWSIITINNGHDLMGHETITHRQKLKPS